MQGIQYHLHNIQEQKTVNSNGWVLTGMPTYYSTCCTQYCNKEEREVI